MHETRARWGWAVLGVFYLSGCFEAVDSGPLPIGQDGAALPDGGLLDGDPDATDARIPEPPDGSVPTLDGATPIDAGDGDLPLDAGHQPDGGLLPTPIDGGGGFERAINGLLGDPNEVTCAPNQFTCENDRLIRCDEEGRVLRYEICPVGCRENGPEPNCWRMTVSNAYAVGIGCFTQHGNGDLRPTDSLEIDTDLPCDAVAPLFDGAAPLCIRIFDHIDIPNGVYVRARGSRGLLLFAKRSMSIHGTLDAAAQGPFPGPGAILAGRGDDAVGDGGGGGAGASREGGAGGSATHAGATGGMPFGTGSLIPIKGGSPGGNGSRGAAGGGGGGGLQLATCGVFEMGPTGIVNASGGGGTGGSAATVELPEGGAGGGSGGYILIQSPTVRIAAGATIVSNGGSGGGGGAPGASGYDGKDGELSRAVAPGGQAGSANAGDGGSGGAIDRMPSTGQPGTSGSAGGGGGGAAGRLRINIRPGTTTNVNGAVISPEFGVTDLTRR